MIKGCEIDTVDTPSMALRIYAFKWWKFHKFNESTTSSYHRFIIICLTRTSILSKLDQPREREKERERLLINDISCEDEKRRKKKIERNVILFTFLFHFIFSKSAHSNVKDNQNNPFLCESTSQSTDHLNLAGWSYQFILCERDFLFCFMFYNVCLRRCLCLCF